MNIIPLYDWKILLLLPLVIAGVYFIPEWAFSWLHDSTLNLTAGEEAMITLGLFLLLFVAGFWAVLKLMLNTIKFEEANEAELNVEKKLTPKGWLLFSAFLAGTLLAGYYLVSISGTVINRFIVFEIAFVAYVVLATLTGAWILNDFSQEVS